MAVTNFYTVNGEIIGEKTAGGTRVDYLTDALGSVTATVSNSAQVVNTYRYKPFGKLLAKTGSGADPAFGWVGSQGYRPTQKKFSDFYVIARHHDSTTGRWPTKDPIGIRGEDLNLYRYVRNRLVTRIDPSGLLGCDPNKQKCCCCPVDLKASCSNWQGYTREGEPGKWAGCQVDVVATIQWKPSKTVSTPCKITWSEKITKHSSNIIPPTPVNFPNSDPGHDWADGSKPNCVGPPPWPQEVVTMTDYPGFDASLHTAWWILKIQVILSGDPACCGGGNSKTVNISQCLELDNDIINGGYVCKPHSHCNIS